MNRRSSARQVAGFTLVEVLVAMAIMAIALAAASRAAALAVDQSAEIKKRVLADLVAQNRLAEHWANDDWLPTGSLQGVAEQGGMRFAWREEISATPNPAFEKVVVSVADPADQAHTLRRLVGFLVNPQR